MTAEVAVMNRSAVALAADSAVTLSGSNASSGVTKVFQNENKLFELSQVHPVGIMLYNATAFFDVPWEVIIKDFRKEVADTACDHIYIWADTFRSYVDNHHIFKPSHARQKEFVEQIFIDQLSVIMNQWSREAEPLFFGKQTQSIRRQYPQLMKKILASYNEWLMTLEHYDGFDENLGLKLVNDYKDELDSAKSKVFDQLPLDQTHYDLISEMAKNVLIRSVPDWFTTGLVFAGFGSNELFPSLSCIELGGAVGDRLRWVQKRQVDIDRANATAEIIPFAQRDTVDTLVFGRSSRYETSVVNHFSEAMRQVGSSLIHQLTNSSSKRKDFEDRLEAAVGSVTTHFSQQHAGKLNKMFADDTLDIVRHMPKPDLAAFAESLVTVSSMKRKVTVGPETVGGPVDVAVISRHEGFIWVKRKLYFDPDLNQRYMSRVFGSRMGR